LLVNTFAVVGTNHRVTGGTSHPVERIINHPQYNDDTLANDISVVLTQTPIIFNDLVSPIALGSVFVDGGVMTTASGWGQTSHPGNLALNLQFVEKPTLSLTECRDRHSEANRQFVFDNTICTFFRQGVGMCMGDSGLEN
jgi:hypothetical protein